MDDMAAIAPTFTNAANANGLNGAEALRAPNDILDENNIDNGEEILLSEADTVELSEESLLLAREYENQPLGDALDAEVINTANNIPNGLENLNIETSNNIDPFAVNEIETGAETTVTVNTGNTLNDQAVPAATYAVETDLDTETTFRTEQFEEEEGRDIEMEAARGNETIAAEATMTASIEESPVPAAQSLLLETEQGAREEFLNEENPMPMENQANQVARANAVLNNANGITPAAPTPEVNITPEDPRTQENMLLQQISTQMAQATPPSNIISLLG